MGALWIETICRPDGRDYAKGAHGVTAIGRRWAVTCDGHRLLAIEGDGPEGGPGGVASLLREPSGRATTLTALREWCASLPPIPVPGPCDKCHGKQPKCDECYGDGEHECDCGHVHDCEKCDGEGVMECDACHAGRPIDPLGSAAAVTGCIDGACVNLRLLAPMIANAPGDAVTVLVTDAESPVHLFGDGWQGVLMPMRSDAPVTTFAGWL